MYRVFGILFTIVGLVGIVLPVIPTTGPLILASGFFIHSSPGLHRWLNGNRVTGPYIRAYTEKRGLSLRRKLGTIAFLWFGLSVSAYIMRDSTWVLLLLAAVGVGVSIHVATIRGEVPFGADADSSSSAEIKGDVSPEGESIEEEISEAEGKDLA